MSYIGVKDAAKGIKRFGVGALLATIPVHPDDRWMLGMMWEGAPPSSEGVCSVDVCSVGMYSVGQAMEGGALLTPTV